MDQVEQSLADLSYLFAAEQDRLVRRFNDERDKFFGRGLSNALHELREATQSLLVKGPKLRRRTMDYAIDVMRRRLDQWRHEMEPKAESLHRQGAQRFVELANDFQKSLAAIPDMPQLPLIPDESGFRTNSQFYYTEMRSRAPFSQRKWLMDVLVPSSFRSDSAARALEQARRVQAAGSVAVEQELGKIRKLHAQVETLQPPPTAASRSD